LPPREDGRADHRRQGRHRRLQRGRLPALDAVPAGVPGSLGRPEPAVAVRRGPPLDELRASPNALAPHYSRFGVTERLLLSGHSHQAWPDVAFDGLAECFADAAEAVDGKWARAEAKAEEVREGYRRLLVDP